MRVEALRKQWDTRVTSAPLYRIMTFEGDDLVLGAGTKLVAVERERRNVRKDTATQSEARLLALLSAAYRRSIAPSTLAYIRRALMKRAEGETVVALTHLAMTGLPKLTQPEPDARRLFMADSLMKAGVAPQVVLQALDLDINVLNELERRYNPDQPRVPAGNGDESGQWTSGNSYGSPVFVASDSGDASRTLAIPTRPAATQRGAIQIADNSDNWIGSLNPISQAHAASLPEVDPKSTEPEPVEQAPHIERPESPPPAPPGRRQLNYYDPIKLRWYQLDYYENPSLEVAVPRGSIADLPKGPTYLSAPGSVGIPESEPDAEPEDIEPPTKDPERAARMKMNQEIGRKWEDKVALDLSAAGLIVLPQCRVRSYKGTLTVVDYITVDPQTYEIVNLIDTKGSATAPPTRAQRRGYPEIAEGGGTYVGRDRSPFLRPGDHISPRRVIIIRPPS